jgi:hypothetical protein
MRETFTYTPPVGGPSDKAHRAMLEAETFKPNPRHAEWCAMREIPKSLRGENTCTCSYSSTAKSLKKLRCSGVLVEPPHFPSSQPERPQRHALATPDDDGYRCMCGFFYGSGTRAWAREIHRLHKKSVVS